MSAHSHESFINGFVGHDVYYADLEPGVHYQVPISASLGRHALWGGDGLAVVRTAPSGALTMADEFLVLKPDVITFNRMSKELETRADYVGTLVNYDPGADLLLVQGLSAGRVTVLKPGEIYGAIGRASEHYDPEVALAHSNTSREHFSIYHQGEELLIHDSNSLNGTRVFAAEMPRKWRSRADATTE